MGDHRQLWSMAAAQARCMLQALRWWTETGADAVAPASRLAAVWMQRDWEAPLTGIPGLGVAATGTAAPAPWQAPPQPVDC